MRRYGAAALIAGLPLLALAACGSKAASPAMSMALPGFARCTAIPVPPSGGWLTEGGTRIHVRAVRDCHPGAGGAYYRDPFRKVLMFTELETLFVQPWNGSGRIISVPPGMHYLITSTEGNS